MTELNDLYGLKVEKVITSGSDDSVVKIVTKSIEKFRILYFHTSTMKLSSYEGCLRGLLQAIFWGMKIIRVN